jgi:hypothetical protein
VVKLDPESPGITPAQLVEYVQRKASARKLTPDGRLMVYLQPFEDVREILQQTKEQLDELLKLKAFAPPPPPPPRRLPTARAR